MAWDDPAGTEKAGPDGLAQERDRKMAQWGRRPLR